MFYCPDFQDQDANELWNFQGKIAVLGYVFLLERGFQGPKPNWYQPQGLEKLAYQNKISPLQRRNDLEIPWKSSSETEFAADAIPATTNTSTDPMKIVFGAVGGGWSEKHQVSHVANSGRPEGGNVLYMDGHVVFRLIQDIKPRTNTYPYFWF